jgi:mono/diheme cytochrome c family protein
MGLFFACGSDSTTKMDGGQMGEVGKSDVAIDTAGDVPSAASLAALRARGKYLVDTVATCGDCHTPQGPSGPDRTKYLAGNPNFVELPTGDKLPSRNLTNDATGLKNRTDDEIKAMFMNGTRPTATGMEALNPFMPYYLYHNMTSADADAIVAYLRTVPGIANEIPRRTPLFDVPAPAQPINLNKVPMPMASYPDMASALRGKYLATQISACVECHTKHLPPGSPTVLDEEHLFEGGEDFTALFMDSLKIKPVSKNLTSDMLTGLGTWTTADILQALKQGKAKDGTGICPPMPFGPMAGYGQLTDQDALDIANYIHSLPPKANEIVDMCVFPPMAPIADGGVDGNMPDQAMESMDTLSPMDGMSSN